MDNRGLDMGDDAMHLTADPGICDQIARLGQHLQDLYNENSLLRERVRVLERELDRASARR